MMRSVLLTRGAATLLQTEDQPSGKDLVSEVRDDISVVVDRWSVGQLGLVDLALAGAVLAVAAAVAWVVRRIADRYARKTTGAIASGIQALSQLAGAILMLMALTITLEILGFSIGPVMMLILIAVVALLIARPIITNLSTGLLLQLRGPFAQGDVIRSNNLVGVVEEVNARTVVLIAGDGRRLHIPNSDVLTHVIENYSAMGRRRSEFEVTVAWNSDITFVSGLLSEAVGGVTAVLDEPAHEVNVSRFEGRYVVLTVLFWHLPELEAQRRATDCVGRCVIESLEAAGVEIDGPDVLVMTRE
jgi:small conductance mechanosensitive channel